MIRVEVELSRGHRRWLGDFSWWRFAACFRLLRRLHCGQKMIARWR
jgi:hypothetical protein